MSILSKIATSQIGALRKLYDYQISMTGVDAHVIFLKIEINKYKDSEITVRSHGDADVVIDLPADLPMSRLRQNITDTVATTNSVFLFDVLPIRVFTQFSTNIEKGDLIIHKISSGVDNYFLVMEIDDTMGNIQGGHIVYKEHNASPYTRTLPVEVVDIIDGYKGVF